MALTSLIISDFPKLGYDPTKKPEKEHDFWPKPQSLKFTPYLFQGYPCYIIGKVRRLLNVKLACGSIPPADHVRPCSSVNLAILQGLYQSLHHLIRTLSFEPFHWLPLLDRVGFAILNPKVF